MSERLSMVAGSLLALSCNPADGAVEGPLGVSEPPEVIASRVESAVLSMSTATLQIALPGEVTGSEDTLLAAALGGYVESVSVEVGDAVGRGQVLARVDTEIHGATAEQTAAQLDLVRGELHRITALEDLASDAAVHQLQTQVAVAEAAHRQALARLGRAKITAPFAGTVGAVAVAQGEVAPPGAPVIRLVSLDPVVVTVSVADSDIGAVTVGLPARVATASAGDVRAGRVSLVSPVADLRTRTFLAEIEVDNGDGRLLPGMIARVELEHETGSAIVIPQEWIVTRLDGYGVFTVNDGVAAWQPVELGEVGPAGPGSGGRSGQHRPSEPPGGRSHRRGEARAML